MTDRWFKDWAARAIAVGPVVPAVLAVSLGLAVTSAQQPQPPQSRTPPRSDNTDVVVAPLQGNLSILVGAGANIVVQVPPPDTGARFPAGDISRGETGVLLVDTGLPTASDKVRAAIRSLSNAPIRYIIDTNVNPDHVGGNANIARPPDTGRGGRGGGRGRGVAPALILAHETVLGRLSERQGEQPAVDSAAWPTDAYLDEKEMWFNGESIQVFHQPAAHSDGDSIVYFRRSDVVCAGDIFSTISFPIIDHDKGGNINGIIDGLNRILDLTIVSNNGEGGTLVVPGHGRISDEADVVEYRNMVVIVRDRIQALIKQGMTVEQVKSAKPTLDYDFRYGATTGPWTTEKFIEAVYSDLAKNAPKATPAAPSRTPRPSEGR